MQSTRSCVLAIGFGASLAAVGAATAQTVPADYTISNLASGISFPTAMAVAPNGDVYICQQAGTLRVWQSGVGLSNVATFTVDSSGERGLIGVALDPAFATSRLIYVYHTLTTTPRRNRVSRIEVNAAGTAIVAGTETVLVELDNLSSATNHNGGALHFGLDGKLYVAVGDNANGGNSQSIANRHGKILRLNPDGSIPADNPAGFPGISGTTSGANRSIWAVGLRNPFTFAVHPATGRMFINDVGQNTWEEINDGLAGVNYGWPATEGSFSQAAFPSFTRPLVAYHHGNGSLNVPGTVGNFIGLAITGGVFYSPPAGSRPNFPRHFENDYFFGDVIVDFIRSFDPATNIGGAFGSAFNAAVDLRIAPDGTLLVLRGAGGNSGVLSRITHISANGACCTPAGDCSLVNGRDCPAPSEFFWGATSCTPTPCTIPTGACCRGATCEVTVPAACTGAYTSFVAGAGCNAPGNQTTPCCQADFNQSGVISVQDIFDFMEAYFQTSPTTDINASGVISVQDIFDFLEAYFNGCE